MYFSGNMTLVRFVYNILISLSWIVLKVIALFNSKMRLFVLGRKGVFQKIEAKISDGDKLIWMHVASLGEYEQGLPILERIKLDHPLYKIVLTFFSPSGYEVKKDTPIADIVVYLPMDTISNAKKFLDIIKPELVIFVKYEIWPNYLHELRDRNIPTFLVSAIFSKRQVFFKSYGSFMRNSLRSFSHFFVQNENSKELLASIGHKNVTVSGDTRFDRVSKILNQDNGLDFMDDFKKGNFCLVAGSTWPEDEEIIIDFINTANTLSKYIIAPHKINETHINKIQSGILKKSIRFSKITKEKLSDYKVIIIDTIGLLTKIYAYADFAYVGGAFATGLHNTLEPAVFGIPVTIGPNYHGFKEAEDLIDQKGIYVIKNKLEFTELMTRFINDDNFRKKTGAINSNYIAKNVGATKQILNHIDDIL
ncbi:Lipid IV(A) 3-deoxy-D-manno-octulosonic acid transferase [Flagellimonas maritima]|uniref:3-deoxy-D-manno-octulosonic acid transferase n=2 Tax=Flagellimonas maritima TaxID=1383885 RepID=A0A2Z4LTI9_9FLAO|nr:Lipid IV(A) 3-deoxy-D-manno-octulosonic acid transferase [Allomuricauda aurantiaca]